jgi:hypothetical protein
MREKTQSVQRRRFERIALAEYYLQIDGVAH